MVGRARPWPHREQDGRREEKHGRAVVPAGRRRCLDPPAGRRALLQVAAAALNLLRVADVAAAEEKELGRPRPELAEEEGGMPERPPPRAITEQEATMDELSSEREATVAEGVERETTCGRVAAGAGRRHALKSSTLRPPAATTKPPTASGGSIVRRTTLRKTEHLRIRLVRAWPRQAGKTKSKRRRRWNVDRRCGGAGPAPHRTPSKLTGMRDSSRRRAARRRSVRPRSCPGWPETARRRRGRSVAAGSKAASGRY